MLKGSLFDSPFFILAPDYRTKSYPAAATTCGKSEGLFRLP